MSTLDNDESVNFGVACSENIQKKVRTWKKPIGKPKRPLSAYNIYFQLERDRIVSGEEEKVICKEDVDKVRILPSELMPKRRDRKTHGKVGFGDLARLIGSKWEKLSGEEKLAFNERARIEKIRYRRDVEEWVQRTNDVKDFHQCEISEDTSNVINDETQFMAFGGKLGRIFLGDDASRTDHAHQSICPSHDYHCDVASRSQGGYQNLLGTTKCEVDDFLFRRNMSFRGIKNNVNIRDLTMKQQYVSDLDEAAIARSSMVTTLAYDRAMAVQKEVQSTVGYGGDRYRSLVARSVLNPSEFPQWIPASLKQTNRQPTYYLFSPMSMSQIVPSPLLMDDQHQALEYQNVGANTFTGLPSRDEHDYRCGREIQLQKAHQREFDHNNVNSSWISTAVNLNEVHGNSHRLLSAISTDPDSFLKTCDSNEICEYLEVPQDNFEDDFDTSDSIRYYVQHNSGNSEGCGRFE